MDDGHRTGNSDPPLSRQNQDGIQRLRECLEHETARAEALAAELKAIRELERRLDAHVPTLFAFTKDASGRFTKVSEGVSMVLGYQPSDLAAGFREIMSDHPANSEASSVEAMTVSGHVPSPFHIEVLDQAGARIWLEITEYPVFDQSGRVVGSRGTARDVTEEVTRRDRRSRVGKLESLGALAGGIAHEFNNLLAGILGNVQLLLMEVSDDSSLRERLAEVERAAIKASSLTKQMLAYSGDAAFELSRLDVNTLTVEADSLLQRLAPPGTSIRYHLVSELPAIWGDAAQIRQVLINLVVNAGEAYGKESGQVGVVTGRDDIGEDMRFEGELVGDLKPGRYVFLEVIDHGAGMDRATVQRIFDPFFSTKFAGRGLGLAAVLGVVRSHKGAVGVRTSPGRGTSVRIWFPIASISAEKRISGDVELRDWKGEGCVFVVDDEERVRSVLHAVLKKWGFSVLTASNGKEAVDIFRKHAEEIRAVLLDMIMPEMNGDEAFQIMRSINPHVPVIMISGYAEEDTVRHLREQGLADIVHKPFEVKDVVAALRDVLETDGALTS